MADIKQLYTILNKVASESLGESAVSVTDTTGFVSLGDAVLSSATNTDAFVNALVDRIGRTIFVSRRYEARYPSIVKYGFEFGVILQKISVDLPDARPNNAWEIGKNGYAPAYAPVFKPTVRQKLFTDGVSWEFDITIPDNILRTAFQSEAQMGALIDAIFSALENSMELALENAVNLTRATAIAFTLHADKPCASINLLSAYNTAFPSDQVSASTALTSANFLRFASQQILLWTRRMRRMSTLFNSDGRERFTPEDRLVLTCLDEFASATDVYLKSDTYHDQLVAIPNFDTVPYWQGSGQSYSLDDTSRVIITYTPNGGEAVSVNQAGVLAVAYDIEAIGTAINDRRTTSERNNKDEYTNYYNKATMQYFHDTSENVIVFYIAE